MPDIDFEKAFEALAGNPPFPWQTALFEHMRAGDIPRRATCRPASAKRR